MLQQNQGVRIFSNGTNYFTQRGFSSASDGLGNAANVTGLTADAAPTTDDLVYVIDDPGGTPAQRKVSLGNLKAGALVANGANCGVGLASRGVDTTGAAEDCFDVATQAELDAYGVGPTTGVTGLTDDPAPSGDDLIRTVNDPAGTPANRKVTITNLFNAGLAEWQSDNSSFCLEDGTNCPTATDHGALTGLNDNDHGAVYCLFTVSNVDPGAGAVASACHIWINDAVTPKRIFYGEGVAANFEDFAALGDAHNGQVVGVVTVAASGSEDLRHLDVLGLSSAKLAYEGTGAFSNQPANDGIEAISSNAGDTTQSITAYCTLNGEDQSLAHIVTLFLNGTSFVASSATNLQNCWAFVLSATTAGNITIREASGDATITTITAGNTSAADLDILLTRRDFILITLNIDRDAALLDTDDRANFWTNHLGRTVTIHSIEGLTDTGTSTINIQRNDGSAADICSSDIVADNDGTFCATLSATEKLISNTHRLSFDMVTAATSGTPTKVTVSIKAY